MFMGLVGVPAAVTAVAGVAAKEATAMHRNLKRAGLFLRRESQKLCPVRFGKLKGSAYTRSMGSGFKTAVEVGYTANYAVYVHENLNARHENGQAKFLEHPAREKKHLLADIIAGKGERWRGPALPF